MEQALAPGERRHYAVDGPLTLSVPGLLEIVVRPGSSVAEARQRVAAETAALNELLSRLGVASPAEAEAAWRRRQELWERRRLTEEEWRRALGKSRLEELEGQWAELGERQRALAARPAELPPAASAEDARRLAEDAYAAMQAAEDRLRQAEGAQQRAVAQLAEIRRAQERLAAEALACQERAQALGRRLDEERRREDDQALANAQAEAEQTVARWQATVAELAQALAALQPEAVRVREENARQWLARAQQALGELKQAQAECQARLAMAGGEGRLEQLALAEAEEARARQALDDLNRRAQAAKLLFETLEACREAEQRAYREPLKARITQLGRVVFGPDFSVELDDQLAVARRTLRGLTLPLEALSAGAREQIALLVRLAAASLVATGEGVPVILDDTLGHSDDDRLALMAAVLNRVGRDCQIIVLTSAPRRYAGIGDATVVDLWEEAAGAFSAG